MLKSFVNARVVINAALGFSVIDITQYLVENTDPQRRGTIFLSVMHGFTAALVKYTVFKCTEKITSLSLKFWSELFSKVLYPMEKHEMQFEMLVGDLSRLFSSVLAVLSLHKYRAFYET